MLEFYILGCVFIGFIIIVEGVIWLGQGGIIRGNKDLYATSAIVFIWFLVSLMAFVFLTIPYPQVLLPTTYMAYNIIGWMLGGAIVSNMTEEEQDNMMNDFTIPHWAIYSGIAFGVCFSTGSAFGYLAL